MILLLLGLVALGVLAFGVSYLCERQRKKRLAQGKQVEEPTLQQVQNMECCGQHEVCEKDSLLAAVSKQAEYYNDEELDRFRGVKSDEYLSDEIEEFREVLYTMREEEVAGWVRSLQLRGVELPDELKDEVFLIVGERRMGAAPQ